MLQKARGVEISAVRSLVTGRCLPLCECMYTYMKVCMHLILYIHILYM